MTTAIVVDRPAIDRDSVGRWVWFFTASLFVITALAGFAPRSLEILTGARRNPPLVVHVHAAIMGAWLALHDLQLPTAVLYAALGQLLAPIGCIRPDPLESWCESSTSTARPA